jgi:hypothetical protein
MAQIQGTISTGVVGVIKAYSNARKLFQIGHLPVGAMAYGAGNIGIRSIQGLMLDFKPTMSDVKGVTGELFNFIKPLYDSAFGSLGQKPFLGFYVAGYSPNQPFADEWEFLLPRDAGAIQVKAQNVMGACWRGIDLVFTRLIKGFDPRIVQRLQTAGLTQPQIDTVLKGLEPSVIFDGMPVQDAINYATFILRTTIGMSTFEAGVASCGGPLQMAIILPVSGFEWVTNSKFEVQIV